MVAHLVHLSHLLSQLDSLNARLTISVIGLQLLDLLISNHGLLRLLAFLIKNAKIVPDLMTTREQSRSLDDVFETLAVVAILEVDERETSPVSRFLGVTLGGLRE